MAEWSRNNVAHQATWWALVTLDQTKVLFKNAGSWKMKQARFRVPGASRKMLGTLAKMIAVQLDNVFRGFEEATYEKGRSRQKSVNAMTSVLLADEKTLLDLATVVDANYRFVDEKERS